MLQGGCYCRAIRYEVDGSPVHRTNCHCSICRATSGAPFVAWFSVLNSEFQFVSGTAKEFQSSAKAYRTFCQECGTPLTFRHTDDPQYIDITTCSLDHPDQCVPENHTYVADKLNWTELSDKLPRFAKSRSEG
jgi:hypothetical protein